jgi:hypothetical protein
MVVSWAASALGSKSANMVCSLGAERLKILLELKILNLEPIDFGGYILESADFFGQKSVTVLVSSLEF